MDHYLVNRQIPYEFLVISKATKQGTTMNGLGKTSPITIHSIVPTRKQAKSIH